MAKRDLANLINNSHKKTAKSAATEWKLHHYGRSEKFTTCELCGTPIKKFYWIRNTVTRAEFPIGTVCYDALVAEFEKKRYKTGLESSSQFDIRMQQQMRGSFRRIYGTVYDPRNWNRWFIKLYSILPKELKRIVIILKDRDYVVNKNDQKLLMEYHDANRRYPRDIILPNWCSFSLTITATLTINEKNELLKHIESAPEIPIISHTSPIEEKMRRDQAELIARRQAERNRELEHLHALARKTEAEQFKKLEHKKAFNLDRQLAADKEALRQKRKVEIHAKAEEFRSKAREEIDAKRIDTIVEFFVLNRLFLYGNSYAQPIREAIIKYGNYGVLLQEIKQGSGVNIDKLSEIITTEQPQTD